MVQYILRLFFIVSFLMVCLSGIAQVRLTDHDTATNKQVNGKLAAVRFHVSDNQLIDRNKNATYHKGHKNPTIAKTNQWETIAVGVAPSKIVKDDSIKIDGNNPYFLLPLLKDKGKVEKTSHARWQPIVKKGMGHED